MIGMTVRHYEIREKLGAGGMGVVYKAWDTRLDRWVALKFLPQHADDDPLARERFIREAKAASALEHPHICTIHEIGETDEDQLFICMAYYGGDDLKRTIRKADHSTGRAIEIARQIAHALASAHEAGIVHRDIKPSNVMLTEQGDVAIVDFGLAKLTGELSITTTGATLGTVAYMSPEQVKGRELDFRTDLWSFGVILYELLTGKHPFYRDYPEATRRSIIEDEPTPPSQLDPDLPEDIDRVVAKLLAKDRNERFTSAGEAEQALRAIAQPMGSEMPTQIDGPSSRTPKRRRKISWKPAALVAAGALAAVLAWQVWPRSSNRVSAQSLAVMPFENFTGDESKSYVSNGIAAGLINSLSELRGISVLSRSEAWAHRDNDWGARRLGDELGVDTLLEGAVHGKTDAVSVETSLIDVRTGDVVWSAEVQGKATEIPDLTQEIAERLTRVLKVSISEREHRRMSRNPTKSFEAYDYYLRGQEFLADSYRPEDLQSAVELFRQAIRVDQEFALAHVALSEALWEIGQREGDARALGSAREEAEQALTLDPELPAALVALARVQRSEGRYVDSIAVLQNALDKHPDPAAAHRELALSYEDAGDMESAEAALRAATLVGPEDWNNWNLLGAHLSRKGNYREAREAFLEATQLTPEGVYVPHRNLGANEIYLQNWEEAIFQLEQIPGSHFTSSVASNLGTAYFFSDRPSRLDKAVEYYSLAARLDPRSDMIRRNLADVYLIQGKTDLARAQYLEAVRLVDEKLASDPQSWRLRLLRSSYAARAGDCTTALDQMESLSPDLPESAQAAHNSAYVYALCDERDKALESIEAAVLYGLQGGMLQREPEFESLRDDPEFQRLTGGGE
jgi:serine/threonine protein kinase/Flp pilus assembly protein TadD